MTAQEILDRVWRHFVTEGNPRSVDDEARSLVLDLQVAEESLVAAEIAAEAANRNVTQATANLRRIRNRIEASLAAGEVLP